MNHINHRENSSHPLPREVKQAESSAAAPSIPSQPLSQSHPLLVHPWCDHTLLADHACPVEAGIYSTYAPLHMNASCGRGELHSFYALDEVCKPFYGSTTTLSYDIVSLISSLWLPCSCRRVVQAAVIKKVSKMDHTASDLFIFSWTDYYCRNICRATRGDSKPFCGGCPGCEKSS